MNKTAFYRGLLAELEKTAYIPYNQAKPKKPPFYKRPGFWAGVGGVGLAGLGAANFLRKPSPTQSSPPPRPRTPPVSLSDPLPTQSTTNTAYDALNESVNTGSTRLMLGSAGASLANIPLKNPYISTAVSKAMPISTGLWTGGGVVNALNPYSTEPVSDRLMQGGAGALDLTGSLLTSPATQSLARAAPTLSNLARQGAGLASRLGGAPLTLAYLLGSLGKGTMEDGTAAAENHAEDTATLSDTALASMKTLRSKGFNLLTKPDPAAGLQTPKLLNPEQHTSLSKLYSLHNDPAMGEYIKQVTEPDFSARLGYGKYYHLPKWLGGNGYEDPHIDTTKLVLDRSKGVLDQQLKETGLGNELAKYLLSDTVNANLANVPNSGANQVPNVGVSFNR